MSHIFWENLSSIRDVHHMTGSKENLTEYKDFEKLHIFRFLEELDHEELGNVQ